MLSFQVPSLARPLASDDLAGFYLARLRRLLALPPAPDAELDLERLRRKAIYLTFLECRALGVGQQALAMLQAAPRPAPACPRPVGRG